MSPTSLYPEAVPAMNTFDSASGVPLRASCADWRIGSMCAIPCGVAGSVSWVMIIRAALPSGDMNSFIPRLNSELSKTSGGR